MKIVGIILIVIGVVALALQGIHFTTKEKIVDLGPVEASAENEHHIPLPPILGGVALAGGVVLMIAGSRKS